MIRSFAVVIVLLCAAAPRAVAAPQQQHEVSVSIDLSVATQANSALVDARYTFTPSGIDRKDEVVPLLRRFVRHPSAAWLHLYRDGSTIESRTGASLGGVGYLLDGRLYGQVEAGIQTAERGAGGDPLEAGYLALPVQLEIGGRPLELLSLGVSVTQRSVLDAYEGENFAGREAAQRSGTERLYEGVVTFATPNDRLLVSLRAGWHQADWTFERTYEGDTEVSGLRASLIASYQTSPRFSWQLRLDGGREDWDQRRMDLSENYPIVRDPVLDITGDLGLLYWHRGEVGVRVAIGGGFAGQTPVFAGEHRGIGRLSLGVAMRF